MKNEIFRPQRAVVVFRDADQVRWLRWLLRSGFSHVTAIVELGEGQWIVLDPLSCGLSMSVFYGSVEALQAALPGGCQAVLAPIKAHELRSLPWAPFNCVELVKRVLGLREPWIITPWQLYKFLEKERVMSGLGSLFGGAPDTSAQEEQLRQHEEAAKRKAEEEQNKADARRRASRAGQGSGRWLLMGSGAGSNAASEKKSTLG